MVRHCKFCFEDFKDDDLRDLNGEYFTVCKECHVLFEKVKLMISYLLG